MLSDVTGFENPLQAIKFTLTDQLPAKVAEINAATSATLQAWLAGSYVFSAEKTIILDIRSSHPSAPKTVTVTIPADTYTAAELAAIFESAENDVIETTVEMVNYLSVAIKGASGENSIVVGAGTGNSVLGWSTGYTVNHKPLNDLQFIEVCDPDMWPPTYPSLTLWCEGVVPDDDGIHINYDIKARLRVTDNDPADSNIYYKLSRMSRAIYEVLTDDDNAAAAFGGKINTVQPPTTTLFENILVVPRSLYVAQLDMDIPTMVQEEL